MTIPPRIRSPRYNKLKKHTLETFERRAGWISPPEWAVLVGFYPVRAAYSYLLHRFGLLERQESPKAFSIASPRRGGSALLGSVNEIGVGIAISRVEDWRDAQEILWARFQSPPHQTHRADFQQWAYLRAS
jgi:hypothetical protein